MMFALRYRCARALSTVIAVLLLGGSVLAEPDDLAKIPSETRRAGKDKDKLYFLVGRQPDAVAPEGGYGLLIVLPGGDGSREFAPFVKRIYANALPEGYLLAELVAKKWNNRQEITWPTDKNRTPGMKFTTEQFIAAVIDDVAAEVKLDPARIFIMGWSSGGPPAYAATLDNAKIRGALVAMSVFHPKLLEPLDRAKGRAIYVYHSPEDKVCPPRMADEAVKSLAAAGGKTKLATYAGGHGWLGNVFGDIHTGIDWLEAESAAPAAK